MTTEVGINTSEESNDTSEESNHKSEEFLISSLRNKKSPRKKSYIPSVESEITFDADLVLRLRELDVNWERAKPNGKEFFTTFVAQWCGGIW